MPEMTRAQMIANASAFPGGGMTYRQWLIGQSLVGVSLALIAAAADDESVPSFAYIAEQACEMADVAIEAQAEEQSGYGK
jgi:hypothetical protein